MAVRWVFLLNQIRLHFSFCLFNNVVYTAKISLTKLLSQFFKNQRLPLAQVSGKRFVYKFVRDLKALVGYSAGDLNKLVTECAEKRLKVASTRSVDEYLQKPKPRSVVTIAASDVVPWQ